MQRSIRMKMVLWIVPVVILALIATMAIASTISTTSQKQLAYDQATNLAGKLANELNTSLHAREAMAATFATTMSNYESADRTEIVNVAEAILDSDPELLGAWAAYEPDAFDGKDKAFVNQAPYDASGRFIFYWNRMTGSKSLDSVTGYDTDEWYTIPEQTKAPVIIQPYLYEGTLLTSYTAPVLKDGEFLGMVGVDLSLATLDQMVSQIKVFETGYAFLVSKDGTFISAPDKSLIGTKVFADFAQTSGNETLTELNRRIEAGLTGSIETNDPFGNRETVLFYTPVATGDWALVVVAPTAEMLAGVQALQVSLTAVVIAAIVLVSLAIWFVTTRLSKPIIGLSRAASQIATGDLDVEIQGHSQDEIGQTADAFRRMVSYLQEMAQVSNRIAEGDLTVTVKPVSEKDALGLSFQQMITHVRALIGQIQEGAAQLAAASQQLNGAAEQAGYATQQITQSIQQVTEGTMQQSNGATRAYDHVRQITRAASGIAEGAQSQAQSVNNTSRLVVEMAQLITQAGDVSQALTAGGTEVLSAASRGTASIQKSSRGMTNIEQRTTQATEKVKEMVTRATQIGRIVEMIDDIADKTDMLALNAAVEAARAGEHGRGFAVVADQVRKLSEDSKAATREVAGLIDNVQSTAREALTAMEVTTNEVGSGTVLIGETAQALQAIEQINVRANGFVLQLDTALTAIRTKSDGVTNAIEAVRTVVEENTVTVEGMAAGTREVSEAMEGVAVVAEENSAAAEEVSAATEAMSAQVQEVIASAENLGALAQELSAATSQFRLETTVYAATDVQRPVSPSPINGIRRPRQRLVNEVLKLAEENSGPYQPLSRN